MYVLNSNSIFIEHPLLSVATFEPPLLLPHCFYIAFTGILPYRGAIQTMSSIAGKEGTTLHLIYSYDVQTIISEVQRVGVAHMSCSYVESLIDYCV